MAAKLRKLLFKEAYTVALICPLEVEMSAVRYMLDDEHAPLPLDEHDPNKYILGELSRHNVVIASLPEGSQGANSAAAVAVHLARSFPAVSLRLLVGIGGGVPTKEVDIRLGDVVVSTPSGTCGGVVEYDLGKQTPDSFERKGFQCPPPPQWMSIITMMKSEHRTRPNKIKTYISDMVLRFPLLNEYQWPGAESDVLFSAEYEHVKEYRTCSACDKSSIIIRKERRVPDQPHIFYGLVASGNRVLKHARERDKISRDAGGAICFEMEAAGLMNHFPCIVIRGICDYADSHKNDGWHAYAAATAAACCKEMLSFMEPTYDMSLLDAVLSTTARVKMTLSETDQTLEALNQGHVVLKLAEKSVLILVHETLGLRRILTAIELCLKQKLPPNLTVQSFMTIENLCSDVSSLLSEIRALIHLLLQKIITNTAQPETELSQVDPQQLRSEICTLCVRLKEYTSSFFGNLTTSIMQFPVSYYESEHILRVYPKIWNISLIQRPLQPKRVDDVVSDSHEDVSDVEIPDPSPPHIDSISVEECERLCPCQCHVHRPCNYRRLCHKSRETYLQTSHFAPSWAFLEALSLRAARLSLKGRNASISISLSRITPRDGVQWYTLWISILVLSFGIVQGIRDVAGV